MEADEARRHLHGIAFSSLHDALTAADYPRPTPDNDAAWFMYSCFMAHVVKAVLSEVDALAALLDPAKMLASWERAGKVERGEADWHVPASWRIVPSSSEGSEQ